MAQALLAEAIEVLVVKEELRDQVVSTRLLLEVETAVALLHVRGLHVALRVARGADAQVIALAAEVGDEVGRMREVLCLAPRAAIPSQGEDVLHARGMQLANVGVHISLGGAQAREVRQRGQAQVALEGGGDGHGVLRVAGATGRVGHGHPVRLVLGKGTCHLVGLLKRKVPLWREDLEGEGLLGGKLLGYLHLLAFQVTHA